MNLGEDRQTHYTPASAAAGGGRGPWPDRSPTTLIAAVSGHPPATSTRSRGSHGPVDSVSARSRKLSSSSPTTPRPPPTPAASARLVEGQFLDDPSRQKGWCLGFHRYHERLEDEAPSPGGKRVGGKRDRFKFSAHRFHPPPQPSPSRGRGEKLQIFEVDPQTMHSSRRRVKFRYRDPSWTFRAPFPRMPGAGFVASTCARGLTPYPDLRRSRIKPTSPPADRWICGGKHEEILTYTGVPPDIPVSSWPPASALRPAPSPWSKPPTASPR